MDRRANTPADARDILASMSRLAGKDLPELAASACVDLCQLARGTVSAFALVDGPVLTFLALHSDSAINTPPPVSIEGSLAEVALSAARTVRSPWPAYGRHEADGVLISAAARAEEIAEITVSPVISGGVTLGVLYLATAQTNLLNDRGICNLEEFASRVAAAVVATIGPGGNVAAVGDELQDTAIQLVFSIFLASRRLERMLDGGESSAIASGIADDAAQAMRCLRARFDEMTPELPMRIEEMVTGRGRRSRLAIEMVIRGVPSMTTPQQDSLAMAVVETGLSNANRHSDGSAVLVSLVYTDCTLEVSVSDDGRGPVSYGGILDTPYDSMAGGLCVLRDRFLDVSGSVLVRPNDDGGFLLQGAIPLEDH